jgi:RHS repeat-associated protein
VLGRIISPIPATDPPYSGSCTTDPGPGEGSQRWLSELLALLGQLPEAAWTAIGDPVDAGTGHLRGPLTDLSLGGLAPALEFSRAYDGGLLEEEGAQETLLGPGWSTSLDWRITTFGQDPEGVVIRAGDGRQLAFLRQSGGGYVAVGGAPFTFAEIPSGYELRRLDRSGHRFAQNGRLAAVLHRSGREMTVQYDANGRLASFTDAASRTAQVSTDAAGHITNIELPDGRQVSYEYDADGRLVGVTDLAGRDMRYVLDRRGHVKRILDDTETVVLRNVYDGAGRVIRQTDGEGNETHLAFDPGRGTTQAFGARGDVSTMCFDQNGRLYTGYDASDGRRAIDYDTYGHPRLLTDELGAKTYLESDKLGRLTSVRDALGRELSLDYDSSGNLIELTDPEERTIEVDYGSADLPESITISDATRSEELVAYTYTARDELKTVTEPGGATTTLGYDTNGYVSSILDPAGGKTTFTTDARGFVTSIIDPLGNVQGATPGDHEWQFGYDAMGRLTSSTDATGGSTQQTYDHMGRIKTLTDAAGITTTYTYDTDGRLIKAKAQGPSGPAAIAHYEYDPAGNLTAITDPEDRRTELTYDAVGRLTKTKGADGKQWRTAYDDKGRIIATTDPTDRAVSFEYDEADRLVRRTDEGGQQTTYEYDDAGRLLSVTDPLLQVTEYEYDWLGRLTQVSDPLSQLTTFGYDAAHDLVSVTNARNKTTTFEYDAAHRLTKVIDALLGETDYEYDEAGRLTRRQNARGHAELYEYDAAGRLIELTDPLANSWQTAYDPAGRVEHTLDAEGQQTDYAYDPLGRLVTISPASGSDITFSYDLSGRRLSMSDGAGTTSYAYDPLGRLTGTSRGGRSLAYEYDDAGRLTQVDYPGSLGSVALSYDAKGRPATISDWEQRQTTFAYDALDRLTSLSRPGDLASSFEYDALGRVTAIEHAHDGTPLMNLGYTYDAVGNLVTRSDDQGTASFSYDALDRLTAADYPGSDDYAYSFDAVGNMTSITTPAGSTNHSYDAADRISDAGYLYDDNGALLSDGTRSFSYDALGRVTGVSGPGLSASYTLDGEGNRISETVNSVTTDFDLDLRGLPTALVAGDKSYLPGTPSLGHAQGGDWLSSLTDAQGSVLQTIDEQGTTSPLVRYDPYGNARPGSSLVTGIGYTGEWTDGAGLINLRFRAYDPTLGRFLSRDTFGGAARLPQSANRHSYALGNPLRYSDPSGHFVSAVFGSGGRSAVGGIIVVSDPSGAPACDWWNVLCHLFPPGPPPTEPPPARDCGPFGIFCWFDPPCKQVSTPFGRELQCDGGPNGSGNSPPELPDPRADAGLDPREWVQRGDYTIPPAPGWKWRTSGDAPAGSPEGSRWNPQTEEYLRYDPFEISHGPHVDYRDENKVEWRVFEDGRMEKKYP